MNDANFALPAVSVVIVSYNTQEKLRKCLAALSGDLQIIVVDNDSHDGSPDMVAQDFPHVTLLRQSRNLGFGAANNIGLQAAQAPLVLYLNSDAYAYPDAISVLAANFRDPGVIAAGGMLLNPDGTLQDSTANELTLWAVLCEQFWLEKAFRKNRLLSPYWNTQRLLSCGNLTAETTQVMGACLMTRAKDVRWDERFFLYCEDTDLCKRLRKRGRIMYVPAARFTHELGSSSSNRAIAVARYNRGKEIYFRIHHGRLSALGCLVLNRTGALLRLIVYGVLAAARSTARPQARMWWDVLTAQRRGPDSGTAPKRR